MRPSTVVAKTAKLFQGEGGGPCQKICDLFGIISAKKNLNDSQKFVYNYFFLSITLIFFRLSDKIQYKYVPQNISDDIFLESEFLRVARIASCVLATLFLLEGMPKIELVKIDKK